MYRLSKRDKPHDWFTNNKNLAKKKGICLVLYEKSGRVNMLMYARECKQLNLCFGFQIMQLDQKILEYDV